MKKRTPLVRSSRTPKATVRPLLESAVRQHQQGDLDQARAGYRNILKLFPDHPDALHFLARLYCQTGKPDAALKLIRRGIKRYPDNPHFYCVLGNIQRMKSNLPSAIEAYKKATQLDEQQMESWVQLGMTLRDTGQIDQAITVYRQAIAIKPDIAELHNNLGNALKMQGLLDEAIEAYHQAVTINPGFAGGFHNLGSALLEAGNKDEALAALRHAHHLAPNNTLYLEALASCFSQLEVTGNDPSLRDDLLRCLCLNRTDGRGLTKTLCHFLRHSGLHQEDPLLLELLQRQPVCDPYLEDELMAERKNLLRAILDSTEILHQDFLNALATQCFLNEYIYEETAEESQWIEQLIIKVCEKPDPRAVAILACYRPLHTLACADRLKEPAPIIQQQIEEPQREEKLKRQIKSLAAINNETSAAVQAQYEEHPYPRWRFTDRPTPTTLGNYLCSLFPHEQAEFPKKIQILAAGGGTGLQPIRTALRFPDSWVQVIDLSLNSLAYGMRKAQELKVPNIRFAQADLLNLHDWGKQFHFIESYGVLHHLAVPFEGWQALTQRLVPGGVMRLGLYSELARKPIQAAWRLIEEHKLKPTTEGIRKFRRIIKSLDESHPLRTLLDSPDFYSLSECRDLVFHVCEHAYTLPEIAHTIEKLGLEFIGFEFPELKTLRKFKIRFPEKNSENDLDRWHCFEQDNPETFASQYVFWVRKPS